MSHTLCIVICIIASAGGPSGEEPVVLGNGGLTALVDIDGRLASCRWPSPGSPNQLVTSLNSSANLWFGAGWKASVDGQELLPSHGSWDVTRRFAGDGEAIVEVTIARTEPAIRITQTFCVLHDHDCLISRIRIDGVSHSPELSWHACFAPTARQIPGLPVADGLARREESLGFVLPNNGMALSFLPQDTNGQPPETVGMSSLDQSANELVDQVKSRHGYSIALAGLAPLNELRVHGVHSASKATGSEPTDPAEAWNTAGDTPVSEIALKAQPEEGGFGAAVVISFGDTPQTAIDLCQHVQNSDKPALEAATDAYWAQWIEEADLPDKVDEATCQYLREDLLTMARHMDRNTGAIVRILKEPRFDPLDYTRDNVWVARAFDIAGYQDLAEKQISFCDLHMRKDGRADQPEGSWPLASYWNGKEALPDVLLDPSISAWVLASFQRHAEQLPDAQRKAFLEARWPCIQEATNFLVRWTDARNREPLAGFDPAHWRDKNSDTILLEHFMGVDAGLRMAATISKPPGEGWGSRKRELDALIRFHCVTKGGQWKSSAALPFWQDGFLETALPSWDKVVESWVSTTEGRKGPSAREVCDAALAFQGRPERLNDLKALVPAPRQHGEGDPYAAALHFITIAAIYSETK